MFGPKKAKTPVSQVPLRTPSSEFIGIEVEAIESQPRSTASDKDGVVVIGKGARVSGEIGDCQVLDVYGVVEADVTAEQVIVRKGGGIRGSIQADNVEISGVVEGSLIAYQHLEINETGEVWAEVKYQSLAVAKGAVLKGSIWIEDPTDKQISEAQDHTELPSSEPAPTGHDELVTTNGADVDLNINGRVFPAIKPH